jgi:lipopolysaccharide cholinephosphotransferase
MSPFKHTNMLDFHNLFPDEREKGETSLRQCQLVMLRMLKIFDYLCLRHGVKYFLTGGSLIGAVRHNGFIPWDDDLDVGMTRDNYEQFIKYAVPELPNDIFFQNPQTDKYYPPNSNVEARLRDKYSSYTHISEGNNKWHEGLQVDIFVYDRSYLPHNFFVVTLNKLLKRFNNNLKRARVLKAISKYSPVPLVYSSNYLQYYSAMKSGTFVTKKELDNLVRVKFEDTEVYVPKSWDSYLKRQYGNYMKLPPPEKRISAHDVIADPFTPCDHTEILYWKDRKRFENQCS